MLVGLLTQTTSRYKGYAQYQISIHSSNDRSHTLAESPLVVFTMYCKKDEGIFYDIAAETRRPDGAQRDHWSSCTETQFIQNNSKFVKDNTATKYNARNFLELVPSCIESVIKLHQPRFDAT